MTVCWDTAISWASSLLLMWKVHKMQTKISKSKVSPCRFNTILLRSFQHYMRLYSRRCNFTIWAFSYIFREKNSNKSFDHFLVIACIFWRSSNYYVFNFYLFSIFFSNDLIFWTQLLFFMSYDKWLFSYF